MELCSRIVTCQHIFGFVGWCLIPTEVLSWHEQDDIDEMEMRKMEEAREAYIAAVQAAKENQDEESLAIAARARLHLQSFVFRTDNQNVDNESRNDQMF